MPIAKVDTQHALGKELLTFSECPECGLQPQHLQWRTKVWNAPQTEPWTHALHVAPTRFPLRRESS